MSGGVPMEAALLVAGVLFALGVTGILVRRNVIFTLMCIEVMMNAAGLAFVAGASRWASADGQIMFILILTLAAAETSVGLALVIQLYRHFHGVDVDAASAMHG